MFSELAPTTKGRSCTHTLPRLRTIAAVALCALLASCSGPPAKTTGIAADNARVRALLPGQSKTVGYVDLSNQGDSAVTLIKATSAHARVIEIHSTGRRGDMVTMRRVDSLEIPAKDTVRLAPGGLHLMLFGVEHLPPSIEIALHWATGDITRVSFARVNIGAA